MSFNPNFEPGTDPSTWTISLLKEYLKCINIDTTKYSDKRDLIEKVLEHQSIFNNSNIKSNNQLKQNRQIVQPLRCTQQKEQPPVKLNQQSNHLDGINICDKLEKSSFGIFKDAINGLDESIVFSDFHLPQVVVIGNESSGKSSLLEKITKCHLFPRDIDMCTKMPVKLELIHCNNKAEESVKIQCKLHNNGELVNITPNDFENLPDKLSSFMKLLGNDIYDDELLIQIKSEKVITFTLIDLPGIRAVPEKLRVKTNELANKYMRDEENFIICVAPADMPRLTSYGPFEMIERHKKQDSSMLVLSMADRVPEELFDDYIIKRVSGKSNELSCIKFTSCVAIINRTHLDEDTLLAADEKELNKFNEKLRSLKLRGNNEFYDQVRSSCGINGLLAKLDEQFGNFIKAKWKPKAIERIEKIRKSNNESLAKLGPLNPTLADVMNDINNQVFTVNFQYINENVPVIEPFRRVWLNLHWGRSDWLDNVSESLVVIEKLLNDLKSNNDSLNIILSRIRNSFNDKTPMKTIRFEKLLQIIEASFKKEFAEKISKFFDNAKNRCLMNCKEAMYTPSNVDKVVIDSLNFMKGAILIECIEPITRKIKHKINEIVSDVDALTESLAYQDLRKSLTNKKIKIESSMKIIENI